MTDSSRTQATIGERVACLRKLSYAKREYAAIAQKRLFDKTGRAPEIVSCGVCRGYHLTGAKK